MSINYAAKIPPNRILWNCCMKVLQKIEREKQMQRWGNEKKKFVDGKLSNQMLRRKEKCIKSRTKWRKTAGKGENVSKKTWLRREAVDALYRNCALKLTHHVPANLSWQSQRLTGSLVLLFPFSFCLRLANVSFWRFCLYLSALPAAPGCDFHFSRVV